MPTAHLQTSGPSSSKVDYISLEEAAGLLDKAPRTVLALAKAGKIASKRERDPEKRGQMSTFLHAGDVARLCHERDHETPGTAQKDSMPKKAVSEPRDTPAPQALARIDQLFRDAEMRGRALFTPQPRPWLTLEEAAEFSGLTRRWLLDAAARNLPLEQSVMVAVRDMGKGSRGGRWRFLRSDLERA